MTELYHHEQQQTKLTERSPPLTRSEMPSFYPSTTITKHLPDQDDDPDSIYKEALIIQIFQHWKMKTLVHQHAINNPENITISNRFSQEFTNTIPSVETSSIETISNETSLNNNKDEVSNINEPEKPMITMQKRVTPLPASYTRRKNALKKSTTVPSDFSNPNLLAPYTKNKYRTTNTTTVTSSRKSIKPGPIFIAPKKTQPSPLPRSYSIFSFDESAQNKRKATLEKQSALGDDPNPTPTSPTWAPAPPTTPTRFYPQSSSSSLDDDEGSSDESNHESLLIRNKKDLKKPKKTKEKSSSSNHSKLIIPTAIFITDPNGHSRTFDLNNDSMEEEFNNTKRIDDNDLIALNINSSYPNSTYDHSSSSSTVVIIPPTPPIILDKYALHSIGEEEEESIEKNNNDRIILSKELDRIEAFTRSRHTISHASAQDMDQDEYENDKIQLGRRWSDGFVKDDEQHTPSPLTKMSSTTSITKQSVTAPAKISKTKYLLMKLHLTSSSNKDDDSNTSLPPPPPITTNLPPRKHSRTNLQTPQSSIDEPKQTSNFNHHDSSNTSVLTDTIEPQSIQRNISVTDRITTIKNEHNREDSQKNRSESVGNRESTADSDDDMDVTFEKAKMGSQLSINSTFSEAKSRYGLDISGTIELKLSYNINTGSLDILIKKCTNLARAKRNQTSNPYCKIYLLPDKSKTSKRKTTVKKGTIEPVFGESFRYHLSTRDFDSYVLWISVWSQTSIGHNDFLGEIHIQLASCTLDKFEEYTLLARIQNNNLTPNIEPTVDSSELNFQLTFIENPKNKDLGTIQVSSIQGKAIYYGKNNVDAICKGILMPDKIKRKLPIISKGPSPKWDIPLRWENIRRDYLKNTSIEISIWCQERFRKTMIGFIRLNLSQGHFDNKSVKWLNATDAEKSAWELFLQKPTNTFHFRLPLRPATNENK